MQSKDYEKILNAMPETGIYVIREEDHGLLYFNKRVQAVSPDARLGIPCHEVWVGSCSCCPLLDIEGQQEARSVSYNDAYGGVVDITATRTLWVGSIPAFVVTVAPRMDTAGYTYRKILHINLDRDQCEVLKSDPEGWQMGEGPLSTQLEAFARSGALHPEDVERFVAFTRPEHLRSILPESQDAATLIYRRRADGDYRWNLMEVIANQTNQSRTAVLCVKDVHDVLREGLEREGLTIRGQELIRSLGERNFNIYTIDLESGSADLIRVDGHMQEGLSVAPWSKLMHTHIEDRLHEAYQDEFRRRFSLEGLRQARTEGQQKVELLCQWRSGEDYRYISVTAYFGRELKFRSYTVLALQDVDERVRQELAHTKRDMQMAAVLKSRFKMMNTVDLETGQCQRMDLTQPAGMENTLSGDYTAYIQRAMSGFVHPDDAKNFWGVLSLDHLREKAAATEDYSEEVCLYRQQGEPVRWIELRVIYSRQKDNHVMVNILGQDVTREKQQEESRLQALEDRTSIISSLSTLFFSTYYIDLDQDTFRAVTQQRRVGDVLGNEINYTAALQIYANHFVHPDDRAEYLSALDVRHLRGSLRWWQPYVAVEYRKLSENPEDAPDTWEWVRATAVLSRTNSDDMPKTAVYIAQDIAGNRHLDS